MKFINLRLMPTQYLFSTSNFTSTLLNCFSIEHSDFKTKQLRSVLVKLLVHTELILQLA